MSKSGQVQRQSLLFLALAALFLVGMLYGVLLVRQSDSSSTLMLRLFAGEYRVRLQPDMPFQAMGYSFLSTAFFVGMAYLCGLSAIGQPMLFLLPFCKGLGLGYFMGYLYQNYRLSGVWYSLLILLPQTLISLFCLLIACREGLRLSNLFFCTFFYGRAAGIPRETGKTYLVKLCMLLVIGLLGALLSAVGVILFGGWFQF